MKKKSIKNLRLNKSKVATLKDVTKINGGYSGDTAWPATWWYYSFLKICPPDPVEPVDPQPIPDSDPAICTGGLGNCPIN